MKTIEIKSATVKGRDTSSIDLIETALNAPLEKGMVFKDMQNRQRISDVIKGEHNGSITLEDNDYANLKAIVNEVRWTFFDPFLHDFLGQFNT